MRVGLIACSAGKLDHRAPAAELYTGPVYQLARSWIERRVHPTLGPIMEWAILSARHGLVLPHQELDPYDLSMDAMSVAERAEWAATTRQQLLERWGPAVIYQILAGEHYRAAVQGLPMVEDVIAYWSMLRREKGIRPAHLSIGILKRHLKEDRPYGT